MTDVSATLLELASGKPFGEQSSPALPNVGPGITARSALEDAVRPWLDHTPCLTGFSGGRDSSAMLAVAVHVARREGLPLPVPVTIRYQGVADADESTWQELVIRHVGVEDWVRIDVDDELDYLGPLAARLLHRHGVMWPPYFHYEHVLLERAAGGVLLSGHDGDGVFGGFPWGGLSALRRRERRPRRSDLLPLARALAPTPLRAWEAQLHRLPLPWLQPEARRTVESGVALEQAGQPRRWDHWVSWLARRRSLALALSTIDTLAQGCDAQAAHPFLDPRFLAALGRQGGSVGWGQRTEVMLGLFSDILPAEVIRRTVKSSLGGGFWRGASRSFAAEWDGQGVDEGIVDPVALRTAWMAHRPKIGAIAMLQQAWLASGAVGAAER
jgi:asparagine synthase (glutamine-hydrolysing)